MTLYAFDRSQRTLVASWSVGVGAEARQVAVLPEAVVDADALLLAELMTQLSQAAWEVYVEPGSAEATDEQDVLRRTSEEDALVEVPQILRAPNLPGDGGVLVSYIRLEEAAHRVGRTLHGLGEAPLTDAVVAELTEEVESVQRARHGDLSGRARQAVALDRIDASPAQVAIADRILAADPLGSRALLEDVEPSAACVAGAHWLTAAAEVAADSTMLDPEDVFAESDNIEATAIETPEAVVAAVQAGMSPRDVVTQLLAEAAAAARGDLPSIEELMAHVREAFEEAEQASPERQEEVLSAHLPQRVCLLDPSRPAHDLLEDLLEGINAALRLFHEQIDYRDNGIPRLDGEVLPPPEGERWEPAGDDEEPDWNLVQRAVEIAFVNRVRERVAIDADRLS